MEALERSEILPLAQLLPKIEARYGARLLAVEFIKTGHGYVYEFEVITPGGRMIEIPVDAASGAVLPKGSGDLDEDVRELMRALAVEDDPRIAQDLRRSLQAAGFRVEICNDGETAWFLGDTEDYDLIVLDLGLPNLDGMSVLKRWRANGREIPVLVLTARGTWSERVEGIDAGADDYLPKPFRMEELVARARALVRRSAGRGTAVQTAGDLCLDTTRMTLTLQGRPMRITALEYRLLAYLMLHRDRVVPSTELVEHLYGDEDAREANALEALIARLRRKLGAKKIGTRRGFGYFLATRETPE